MRNSGLDEAQVGIKIAGRNSNNLRYADINIFLELFCFFNDLMNVGNLLSGSSGFNYF